jgi:flagellar export protein FliJ
MKAFRFGLQKVLRWRETQLEIEEARFKQAAQKVSELDRARAELQAEAIRTEVEVRRWSPVDGRDLAALGGFRLHVKTRESELAQQRAESQKALEDRQKAMLEARRRCRLLERLKERRRVEWQVGCERELEELASESFLAGWERRRPDT